MLARYGHEAPSQRSASPSLSASLSLSESIDLDIVGDILARARDATSFAQVHDAYSHVLEENGIRPSSDKAYYQFLLKLGMIRARTWGERWDVWQETNAPRVAKPAHKSKKNVTVRRPNPMRERVPFLASASSDLDEGFASESDAGSEATPRESPRKTIEDSLRSLVGYTPDNSGMSSELYPPPMRTSTPVHAQDFDWYGITSRSRAMTPTPPPYSESEANSTIISSPIKARVLDGMVTPKARQVLVSIDDELDAAIVREMERRADTFHRLGLLGRCWGAWSQSAAWIQRTTSQIDSVRDTILLRQSLAKWRTIHEFRLTQPGTADAHYAHKKQQEVIDRWLARLRDRRLEKLEQQYGVDRETDAKRRVWRTWRTKHVQIQTRRWEDDLKKREAVAVQHLNRNSLRRTFDQWRDHTREQTADRHYAHTTVRAAFVSWRKQANHARLLGNNLEAWERRKAAQTLVQTFDLWFKQASLRPLEDTTVKRQEHQLMLSVWSQWQVSTRRTVAADNFRERQLLKSAMSRIKVSIRKTTTREHLADHVVAVRDLALVRKTFNTWACEDRGRLLGRVLATRRLRGAFNQWHSKRARLDDLEAKATEFLATSDTKHLHSALSSWRDVLGQKRNAALKADLIFEARTKQGLFGKWQGATTKLTDDMVTADKAHAFFAVRMSFKVWRIALAHKRQAALVEKKRKADLRTVLHAWRDATIHSLVDRQQVERFRQAQDTKLLSRVLGHWTERVVELKARELDVAEQRDTALVGEAFARWKRASKRKADLVALMQSFIDVKREESARRAFSTWSHKARRALDLRQRLDFFERERAERMLSETFSAWHDLKRERELHAVAEEVALRSEDTLMFNVFDKWTAKSSLLRAVQFDKRRQQRAVFPKWRHALERTRYLRRIAEEHDLRLLADGFAVWKSAYRAKTAKRPALRARRRLTGERRLSQEVSSSDISAATPRRSFSATSVRAAALAQTPSPLAAPVPRRAPTSGAASGSHLRRAVAPGGGGGGGHSHVRAMSHSPVARPQSPERHRSQASVSVSSEPPYSRLRSELLGRGGPRGRVVSDEARSSSNNTSTSTTTQHQPVSELVRALRGAGAR